MIELARNFCCIRVEAQKKTEIKKKRCVIFSCFLFSPSLKKKTSAKKNMSLFFATLGVMLITLGLVVCVFGTYTLASSPFSWKRCGNTYKLYEDGKERSLPDTLCGSDETTRPFLLKSHVHKDMCSLLKDTLCLLGTSHIDVWAIRSTALGAVRHKGFVPWCDKIELAVKLDQLPQLVAARDLFEEQGYQLTQTRAGYTIAFARSVPYPCVDLTIVKLRQGKLEIATPLNELGIPTFEDSALSPEDVLRDEDVFDAHYGKPHVMDDFEDDISLPIPKNTCNYLTSLYGANWNTEIQPIKWQHFRNRRSAALWQQLF